jgi:transposase-like protein
VGKRYTEEEKHRIQELAQQGYTDESIAQQLGRSTNAIRNIRHRNNIKIKETKTIRQLKQQTRELEQRLNQLNRNQSQIRIALQVEDQTFRNKIETELIKLKTQKPELFYITEHEQLSQITTQLATSFIRWLLE